MYKIQIYKYGEWLDFSQANTLETVTQRFLVYVEAYPEISFRIQFFD